MIEIAFEPEQLKKTLVQLELHQQLAFGTACSERLLPIYRSFSSEASWGEPETLREGLDLLWRIVSAGELDELLVRGSISNCEKQAPHSDDFDFLYTSPAQNAVFSICGLLDFLLDLDLGGVILAAGYPVDSIDLLVQEQEDLDPRDPQLEERILMHPPHATRAGASAS